MKPIICYLYIMGNFRIVVPAVDESSTSLSWQRAKVFVHFNFLEKNALSVHTSVHFFKSRSARWEEVSNLAVCAIHAPPVTTSEVKSYSMVGITLWTNFRNMVIYCSTLGVLPQSTRPLIMRSMATWNEIMVQRMKEWESEWTKYSA